MQGNSKTTEGMNTFITLLTLFGWNCHFRAIFFFQWHMTYRKAIQSCMMTVIHFPESITMKTVNDATGCDYHS